MRQLSFSSFMRFLFVISILLGVLIVAFSLVPFEAWSQALDAVAPDGRFESFTLARFQVLLIFLRLFGICLILCFVGPLIYPQKTLNFVHAIKSWVNGLWELIKNDSKSFLNDFRLMLGNRGETFIILLLVFMAVVIRLANLFIPIEYDEAYNYNAFASFPLWHVISDYHVPNNHVLLTIAIHFLTRLLGNHLWVIRLPTFIVGVCMVPVGYYLAKRIYDKDTAIVSAIFITFFPILVTYSVLARGYAIISLVTLLSILVGDYVRVNRNRFAWLILIILSALGFYTIPVMLLPFGSLYVWLLLSFVFNDTTSYRPKLDFLKFYFVGGMITALFTLILYFPILSNPANRLFGNQFVAPVGWGEYPAAILFRLSNTWIDWTSTIPDWLIVLGIAGIILSVVLHGKINRHSVPLQVAFAIWITFFVIYRRPDMETRMWIFIAAPLLIWSAGGLVASLKILIERFANGLQVGKILSGLALTISLIVTISILPKIPARWQIKGSVESTVIYLKDHIQKGDLVWMSPVFVPQTRYYFELYDLPLSYLRQPVKFKRAFVLVRSVDGSADAGDTLEATAPQNEQGLLAIDVESARILLQFEDLTLYECYPSP